jgi:hypothetical protein
MSSVGYLEFRQLSYMDEAIATLMNLRAIPITYKNNNNRAKVILFTVLLVKSSEILYNIRPPSLVLSCCLGLFAIGQSFCCSTASMCMASVQQPVPFAEGRRPESFRTLHDPLKLDRQERDMQFHQETDG